MWLRWWNLNKQHRINRSIVCLVLLFIKICDMKIMKRKTMKRYGRQFVKQCRACVFLFSIRQTVVNQRKKKTHTQIRCNGQFNQFYPLFIFISTVSVSFFLFFMIGAGVPGISQENHDWTPEICVYILQICMWNQCMAKRHVFFRAKHVLSIIILLTIMTVLYCVLCIEFENMFFPFFLSLFISFLGKANI